MTLLSVDVNVGVSVDVDAVSKVELVPVEVRAVVVLRLVIAYLVIVDADGNALVAAVLEDGVVEIDLAVLTVAVIGGDASAAVSISLIPMRTISISFTSFSPLFMSSANAGGEIPIISFPFRDFIRSPGKNTSLRFAWVTFLMRMRLSKDPMLTPSLPLNATL